MITFRIDRHNLRPGVEVIEVRDSRDRLLATITSGDTDDELRILSECFSSKTIDVAMPPLPAVLVLKFKRGGASQN